MSGAAMRISKEEKRADSAVRNENHSVRQENRTGIPAQLKERVEQSTGLSLDDVRVHYNSALPTRLDALAYTKGNQVEVGPGQERHLPHEIGHVVQQKLGMVRANGMHSSGVALNTEDRLERQADEIGAGKRIAVVQKMEENTVQRCPRNRPQGSPPAAPIPLQEHLSPGSDTDDNAPIIRGTDSTDRCTPGEFYEGQGVKPIDEDQRKADDYASNYRGEELQQRLYGEIRLKGISVYAGKRCGLSALGKKVAQYAHLAKTKVSSIRQKNGALKPPNIRARAMHHEIEGITANDAVEIFSDIVDNPQVNEVKVAERMQRRAAYLAARPAAGE